MRKTLLLLLAVLVCCSSLFVVAGCGPKYVDHPHVGVGECESCGANYYNLISDYVMENGKLEEGTYTVELPFSHGGYIYLNYSPEDSDLNIVCYHWVNDDLTAMHVWLDESMSGNYEWFGIYSDTISDEGIIDASKFTTKLAVLKGSKLDFDYMVLNASVMKLWVLAFDEASEYLGLNLTHYNIGFTSWSVS